MAVLNPKPIRRADRAYGSATVAISRRIGPGSVLIGDDVDVSRDEIKTFGFRGNLQGSWFVDVAFGGTNQYFAIAEGTFPAGQGSIKTASATEAFNKMRGRVRMSAAGSASILYGGFGLA